MKPFDSTFYIGELQGVPAVQDVRSKIHAWMLSEPLAELLEMFSADVSLDGNVDEVVNRLEKFSECWDFRRIARERGVPADDALKEGLGSARWLSASTGLSTEAESRILNAARQLGLIEAEDPKRQSYESILVLGGARLSCKLRPLRAAEVIRQGVETDIVGLLGAARPVGETERDATDTYALGAVDEFDLIVAGAQHAFGFNAQIYEEQREDHPENKNLGWVARRFSALFNDNSFSIVAVSAPSSDPTKRRANSADTLLFFLDHEGLPAGSHLLLITSQIYVPYVQLEALRSVALPRNLIVETIGFPGDRMPEIQGMSSPNHYLQEIRSTIQAAKRFCDAYSG